MSTLKSIVENNDTPAGKTFDFFIQFLIIVSLASFSIETLPDLSPLAIGILKRIEVATVLIFTLEYILRLIVAENKIRRTFSFYGVVDLLAILPFYLSLGVDLRSIRAVRLLRLFRAFKLLRYGKAIDRFKTAFNSIKEEMVLFLAATAFILYMASIGIYYCERQAQPKEFASIFDAMWWAIVTLTTVGYGDVSPITPLGKLFGGVVMLVGIGVVAVPSGLLASALTKSIQNEEQISPNK